MYAIIPFQHSAKIQSTCVKKLHYFWPTLNDIQAKRSLRYLHKFFFAFLKINAMHERLETFSVSTFTPTRKRRSTPECLTVQSAIRLSVLRRLFAYW